MPKFSEDDMRFLSCGLPDEVRHLRDRGEFAGELSVIEDLLRTDIPLCLKKRLEFERVIASETDREYCVTEEELISLLRERYPSVTAKHLDAITGMGSADFILRGGRPVYHRAAFANIVRCRDAYLKSIDSGVLQEHSDGTLVKNMQNMQQRGFARASYRIMEQIEPSRTSRRPGKLIRVHLPYPAVCSEQSEITLHSSSHPVYISDSPSCTAFIETEDTGAGVFSVEFSYTFTTEYRRIDPSAVLSEQPSFFTGEKLPHLVFTPRVMELASELRGNEKNPVVLARRAYDFVTRNISYSYMREYLCFENIPDFALKNKRGDCGVMALLFIVLCRAMGVPARWQSGSHVREKFIGSHDWAQFYAAPYGWLYADLNFGSDALRVGDTELWNHYFGNLDPFRMVSCTGFQSEFDPPRRFLRHDPYDNQSGELEYSDLAPGINEVVRYRRVIKSDTAG